MELAGYLVSPELARLMMRDEREGSTSSEIHERTKHADNAHMLHRQLPRPSGLWDPSQTLLPRVFATTRLP